MPNFTTFDPDERYIHLRILVKGKDGKLQDFLALLDTGAPVTEFSDETLQYIGFLEKTKQEVELKHGLQTQKYGKVVLHYIEICSHFINDLEVYVSHFEKSWGIKALIGLDFFRRFRVTIDYRAGHIITEPFTIQMSEKIRMFAQIQFRQPLQPKADAPLAQDLCWAVYETPCADEAGCGQ